MRPVIAVAAGCLVNGSGEALIAQRPAGKIAAGQWEFPGGKIEPGERSDQALARELEEELGVRVRTARPLIRVRHDYSDRTVVLDTWLVSAYEGEPHGRENQAFAWVKPERMNQYPLLAADAPIVAALRLPADYVFTPAGGSDEGCLAGLSHLPCGALLRLRRPGLSHEAYAALARRMLPQCQAQGLGLMLDGSPELAAASGAAGWHARAADLQRLRERPVPASMWFAASVHNAQDVAQAKSLGVDFLVAGSVKATPSHPAGPTLGWAGFSELVSLASVPVYGIGGIGPGDRARLHGVYAQGAAGISAYWSRVGSS